MTRFLSPPAYFVDVELVFARLRLKRPRAPRRMCRGSSCDSDSVTCSVTDLIILMAVDGVQHRYACRLRQLPSVTGEWNQWTADVHALSTGCANKTMMETLPTLLYAGGTLQCVLYLSFGNSKTAIYRRLNLNAVLYPRWNLKV